MAEGVKRKDASTAGPLHNKKRKGAPAGKWKTPHQLAKAALPQVAALEPGDMGIWATCARGQERRATQELHAIFEEYAEIMYGLKAEQDVVGVDRDQDDSEDIESLVEKELQSIEARGSGGSRKVTFTAVQLDIGCLFFMKTRDPIRPVDLVRRICQDAKTGMDAMAKKKTRYLNRLTPSTLIGKASESGVVDLARMVLTPWFDLSGKRGKHVPGDAVASNEESTNVADGKDDRTRGEEKRDASTRESEGGRPESYSYAIRPTIRQHSTLKRDILIDLVANLINDQRHKVNLKSPDKVIMVDIYRTVCGMSVVDGDWDDLKKYNLTELYNHRSGSRVRPDGGESQGADARDVPTVE